MKDSQNTRSLKSSTKQLIEEYKPAILFLLRFLGIYVIGNVIYGLWIVSYGDLADPFTNLVSLNTAWFLNQIGFDVSTSLSDFSPGISLFNDGYIVVDVIEGCNAINVSILFIAFIFAYKSSFTRTLMFSLIGIIAIYIFNIVRVSGLFIIAKYYPENLLFTHRFLFTGVIYAFVFGLWYLWVIKYSKS